MKQGDKVRNTISGKEGVVELVSVPGMRDCALVCFRPGSDGLCIPRRFLVKVA